MPYKSLPQFPIAIKAAAFTEVAFMLLDILQENAEKDSKDWRWLVNVETVKNMITKIENEPGKKKYKITMDILQIRAFLEYWQVQAFEANPLLQVGLVNMLDQMQRALDRQERKKFLLTNIIQ